MKPAFITFTGLDARTDMGRVNEISARYPVEWGVLFSPSKQAKAPRYPDAETIDRIRTMGSKLILSAHLCGGHAMGIMEGKMPRVDLGGFGRAQVNHTNPDPDAIHAFAVECRVEAIAQWRQTQYPAENRIYWLYDCSGGRGTLPSAWPTHPGDARLVGYAGGMGPENVAEVVASLPVGDGLFWIDMESRIRTDDWLDLDKCEAVCRAVFEDA